MITILLDIFLPPKLQCDLQFLQALLTGKKKYLMNDEVRAIKPPNYPELGIAKLYRAIADDHELMKYLPDETVKTSKVSKQFVWSIVDALRPEFAKNAV